MYTPSAFRFDEREALYAMIAANPLGALVTAGEGGLDAEHLPFILDAEQGVLRAHVARANPVWQRAGREAMVIFQGPQAYVSPSWYEGKATHHKEVPTFNYVSVHAHGVLRAIEDPAWILALLRQLTAQHEGSRAQPWSVDDAPRDYIDKLLGAIVGIEVPIVRIDGKAKASQNRSAADQARVVEGLAAESQGASMAQWMRR